MTIYQQYYRTLRCRITYLYASYGYTERQHMHCAHINHEAQQSISLGLIPRIPSSAPGGLRGSGSTLRRSTPSVAAFLNWQDEIVVSLQLAPTNRDPSFLSWNR